MKLRNCCLMLMPTIFLVLASCQHAQDSEQTSGITVIEGATVIDGVSDTPIEDAILVLEGDTIRELGARGTVEPPANARIVSAAGKTIMPAMFALHTHLGRAWNDLEAGEEQFNQSFSTGGFLAASWRVISRASSGVVGRLTSPGGQPSFTPNPSAAEYRRAPPALPSR